MIADESKLAQAIDVLSSKDYAARYFFKSPERRYTAEGLRFVLSVFHQLSGTQDVYAVHALIWLRDYVEAVKNNERPASLTHEAVADSVLELCSDPQVVSSPSVQWSALILGTRIEPEAAQRLIDCLDRWLEMGEQLEYMALDFLAHICSVGDVPRILPFVRKLLWPAEIEDERKKEFRFENVCPRFDWSSLHREFSREDGIIPRLLQRDPGVLLDTLLDVLDEVAHIEGHAEQAPPGYDHSEWWLPSIQDSDQNEIHADRYPGALLVWARDALDALHHLDRERWLEDVALLARGRWHHRMRLAMYSLTEHPENGQELLVESLPFWVQTAMQGSYGDIYHELWLLVNKRCTDLDDKLVTALIDEFASGYKGWKENTPGEVRERLNSSILFEMLVAFEPAISTKGSLNAFANQLEAFRREHGKERSWISFQHYISGARWEQSVPDYDLVTLERMWEDEDGGSQAVLTALVSREPKEGLPPLDDPESWHLTRDNWPVVRELAQTHPGWVSGICELGGARELHPRYVSALAYGCADSVKETEDGDDTEVQLHLDALVALVKLGESMQADQQKEVWQAASMLAQELAKKVSFDHQLGMYLDTVDAFLEVREEAPEWNEDYRGHRRMNWVTHTINTIEGRALGSICHLAWRFYDAEVTGERLTALGDRFKIVFENLRGDEPHPPFAALFGMKLVLLRHFCYDIAPMLQVLFDGALISMIDLEGHPASKAFIDGYFFASRPIPELWNPLITLYELVLNNEADKLGSVRPPSHHFARLWWRRQDFEGATDMIKRMLSLETETSENLARDFIRFFTHQDDLWTPDGWRDHLLPLWRLGVGEIPAGSKVKSEFLSWARKVPIEVRLNEFQELLRPCIRAVSPEAIDWFELRRFIRVLVKRAKGSVGELAAALDLALHVLRRLEELRTRLRHFVFGLDDAVELLHFGLAQVHQDDSLLLNQLDCIEHSLLALGYTP